MALRIVRLGTARRVGAAFTRGYRAEMAAPKADHALNLLARLSHDAHLSVDCCCEDEARCHRSVLREMFAARGAHIA